MADEDRIATLEARLRTAEDHLEILGGYDFSLPDVHDVMRKALDL